MSLLGTLVDVSVIRRPVKSPFLSRGLGYARANLSNEERACLKSGNKGRRAASGSFLAGREKKKRGDSFSTNSATIRSVTGLYRSRRRTSPNLSHSTVRNCGRAPTSTSWDSRHARLRLSTIFAYCGATMYGISAYQGRKYPSLMVNSGYPLHHRPHVHDQSPRTCGFWLLERA